MSDKELLDAPCVFCGYNGAGYWQRGTHDPRCPVHDIGGQFERRGVVGLSLRDAVYRIEKMKDRIKQLEREVAELRGRVSKIEGAWFELNQSITLDDITDCGDYMLVQINKLESFENEMTEALSGVGDG